ncbi:MAG: phosphoesterase, partial [Lachnospiraceae bacterium]|nr:phosphoesterase [Lachnospiraceae bacterium]
MIKEKNKKQYHHIWWFLIYGMFYLLCFFILENMGGEIHIIHSSLDEYIPFCEYFVIPYVLWFLYIVGTWIHFAFVSKSKQEYQQLTATLCIGMTIFLIISFIYPNGHELRPELSGNSIYKELLKIIYYVDTPTD